MDNKEVSNAMLESATTAEDSGSSDSSDSDSDEGGGLRDQVKSALKGRVKSGDHGNEDRGLAPLRGIQEYNEHSEQLHRRHRGMMQWKVRSCASRAVRMKIAHSPQSQGARTAKWMKTKITDGKEQMIESLKHHNRDPGIEKEV